MTYKQKFTLLDRERAAMDETEAYWDDMLALADEEDAEIERRASGVNALLLRPTAAHLIAVCPQAVSASGQHVAA